MPARRQDVLHILRTLIHCLIPGETGLLTEGRHRLKQLIDLRVQEMLPVARLDIFFFDNSIAFRTSRARDWRNWENSD